MIKRIILFFVLGNLIFAQSAGESGLSFLKLGFGARNIAMSDLGVVGLNDLTSLNYNPSLLAVNPKTQLSFTHNSLLLDLNSEMFAGSFSLFNLPVAIGVNTTSISDIEVRNVPGSTISKFNANYFAASISTGHQLYRNLYGGVTFKYLYENLLSDDATGYAFDLGFSYTNLVDGLLIGGSLRNIGNMNSLRNVSTDLPSDFRLGASYDLKLDLANLDLTALTGLQKYFAADDLHLHLGGEINYNKSFSVRLGYMSGYDSKSLTAGFGLVWKGLNLDYAYMPIKYGLGDSHIISFIYSFD